MHICVHMYRYSCMYIHVVLCAHVFSGLSSLAEIEQYHFGGRGGGGGGDRKYGAQRILINKMPHAQGSDVSALLRHQDTDLLDRKQWETPSDSVPGEK